MSKKSEKKRKSMARKTSTVPTKVYAYGALAPTDPAQQALVREQQFAGHLYRNTLVQIERERRDDYRALRASLSSSLKKLEVQHDDAHEAYLAARKKLSDIPKKDRGSSPVVEHVRELSRKRAAIWAKVHEAREEIEKTHFTTGNKTFRQRKKDRIDTWQKNHPGQRLGTWSAKKINESLFAALTCGRAPKMMLVWRRKHKLEQQAHDAAIQARADSGCFTGTYQAVETAAKQSFRHSKFQPAFVHFDHRGKIGAQIAGHVTTADAMTGRSTLIKIDLLPSVKITGRNRGRVAAVAHLCLGKRLAGTNQYIDIPFVMHRPLPPDGVLKWVYLVVKRVGVRSVYELQFTVESETFRLHRENHPGGVIAVNYGWRRMPDGSTVVATTWDGCQHTEMRLPAALYTRQCYAEDLIELADGHFNKARAELRAWWAAKPKLPAATATALKLSSISHWRQPGRLATTAFKLAELYLPNVDLGQLWRQWCNERIEPRPNKDTPHSQWVFARPPKLNLFDTYDNIAAWAATQGIAGRNAQLALYLEWWRRKDKHLRGVARDIMLNIIRHRRELYRKCAREWAAQYKTILIEDWDKRETAETPLPERDLRTKQQEAANRVRHIAGVSYLIGEVRQVVGADLIKLSAKNITRVHTGGCGGPLAREATITKDVVCATCGRMFDQDVNAARNLWERYDREHRGDGQSPGPARDSDSANDSRGVAAE